MLPSVGAATLEVVGECVTPATAQLLAQAWVTDLLAARVPVRVAELAPERVASRVYLQLFEQVACMSALVGTIRSASRVHCPYCVSKGIFAEPR